MYLSLILAALVAAPSADPVAAPPADAGTVDRSLSDQGRLTELRIEVRSAQERGEIDRATAGQFYLAIERIRRQMIRMGMQVGYRQKIRIRTRIDRLYAQLAARRAANAR